MRLVAYLRVSTDRQADDGAGLEVQEAAIRAWATRERHRIVAVVSDTASGVVPDRPGLAVALGHIKAGRAGGLVVYRADRLARELVLAEQLRREVIQHGGVVRSTDPVEDLHLVDDPDNPTGTLVRQILQSIAEYERALIRLRMRAGKEAKIARGGYAHGRPPYGYRAVGGDLVPDVDERRNVAKMRRWRREGLSYRQIVDKLAEAGIKTRSGRSWSPQGVSRVIGRSNLPREPESGL